MTERSPSLIEKRTLCNGFALRIALVVLIPLALLEAWWLTPDRDYYKEMDFAVFYSAGRMFSHGQNPFDRARAEDVWLAAGGHIDVMDVIWGPRDPDHPADHWLPIELIPPGLAVFSVISFFPVPTAWVLWNVIVAVLFLGQLYAMVRLMRRPLWDSASLAMILFTILLEPLHIGLANGQPTAPTISLIVLALYFSQFDRQLLAGIAFAIATALKPQVAAPFVMLFIYQGKWKTVWTAAALGFALTLIAVIQLQVHDPHWLASWISEVRFAELPGGIDDARVSNPGRNDLLYLALLGHLFTDDARIVNALSFTIFALLVALLFFAGRRRKQSLAMMAAFSMLVLLPMYHRYYDAGLVALPVAWALCNLRGNTRFAAVGSLLVSCAYLIPADWLNKQFRNPSAATLHAWWFNALAEPHHVWELLFVFGCLLVGVLRTRNQPEAAPVPFITRQTLITHGSRMLILALIPLALCEAWWTTPSRDDGYKQMDFAMYYTASRMFVHASNPYDRTKAEDVWTDAGGDDDVMFAALGYNTYDEEHPGSYWLPINLIPPALAVIAPFALFGVNTAWPMWNIVVALLLLGQTFALIRLMGKPIWHPLSLIAIIVTILLEPLHIGLANGQPAVPAVSLIVISLWLARVRWQVCAGVALAIATSLKPQLAGPFALYFVWQRDWKTVVTAAIVGVSLALLAILPMQAHGIHWLAGWLGEVKYAEVAGGINDARVADAGRHDMIHLQVLLHLLSDNATLVNVLSGIVTLGLGVMLYMYCRSHRASLAPLAAFSVLALLPVYHRLYDAGILVLPVAWALCHLTGPHRWLARLMLLVIPAFFIDEQWLDGLFVAGGNNPNISDKWWFNALAEPHHVWELLVIFACVIVAIACRNGSANSVLGASRTMGVSPMENA
jgi:hypothetical protein